MLWGSTRNKKVGKSSWRVQAPFKCSPVGHMVCMRCQSMPDLKGISSICYDYFEVYEKWRSQGQQSDDGRLRKTDINKNVSSPREQERERESETLIHCRFLWLSLSVGLFPLYILVSLPLSLSLSIMQISLLQAFRVQVLFKCLHNRPLAYHSSNSYTHYSIDYLLDVYFICPACS